MPPKKDKAKLKKGSSSSGSAEGPLVQLRPSEILYTYSKVLPYFSGCGRTLRHTLDEIALLLGRSLAGAVRCAARRRCPARRVREIGSRHVPFERTKSGAFYNYTLVFHPSLGFNT